MAKSPISWVGGKYRLADKIISLFPEHTLYAEVFGGAGHILFRKPPSKVEIYNDINRNLVCFFSAVKNKDLCGKLYDRLNATPYSRDMFNQCLHNLSLEVISDLERAYSFIVVNKSMLRRSDGKLRLVSSGQQDCNEFPQTQRITVGGGL